jgi:hypothetical protein
MKALRYQIIRLPFGIRRAGGFQPPCLPCRPCAVRTRQRRGGIDFRFNYQPAARVRVRIPAARKASGLCVTSRPRRDEGAGKTGCTLHPRSRVQLRTRKAHTSIQVQAEHPGLPCAVALRLTSCSPRRTAFLPPSSPRSFASLGLNASTATSGPHDFAVRLSHTRQSQLSRPPHPTARS